MIQMTQWWWWDGIGEGGECRSIIVQLLYFCEALADQWISIAFSTVVESLNYYLMVAVVIIFHCIA